MSFLFPVFLRNELKVASSRLLLKLVPVKNSAHTYLILVDRVYTLRGVLAYVTEGVVRSHCAGGAVVV